MQNQLTHPLQWTILAGFLVMLAVATLPSSEQATPTNPVRTSKAALRRPRPQEKPADVLYVDKPLLLPQLAERVTTKFDETPLIVALRTLATEHGFSLLIDHPALADEGYDLKEPVEWAGDGLQLRHTLNSILHPWGLGWRVSGNIVVVSTITRLGEIVQTRTYPVRDLVKPRNPGVSHERLIQVLQSGTSANWEYTGGIGGTIRAVKDSFVVQHTPQIHLEITQLLTAIERLRPGGTVVLAPDSHANLAAKLKQRIDVDFQSIPLKSAVRFLTAQQGIPVHIDKFALADEAISDEEPVTLKSRGRELNFVLRWLLTDLGLTTICADGRVLVTTITKANEPLQTVLYDVTDLVHTPRQYLDLVTAITDSTNGYWFDKEGPQGALESLKHGVFMVRQPQSTQREIQEMLADLRKHARANSSQQEFESAEPEIRTYSLALETARDFANMIPEIIAPSSWQVSDGKSQDFCPEVPPCGKIFVVDLGKKAARSVEGLWPKEGEESGEVLVSQAVLVIQHTPDTLWEIDLLLRRCGLGWGIGPEQWNRTDNHGVHGMIQY